LPAAIPGIVFLLADKWKEIKANETEREFHNKKDKEKERKKIKRNIEGWTEIKIILNRKRKREREREKSTQMKNETEKGALSERDREKNS